MPTKRPVGPDDKERILRELRSVSPIPLTRLDLTDELNVLYARTSELLAELERDGAVRLKYYGLYISVKGFFLPEQP